MRYGCVSWAGINRGMVRGLGQPHLMCTYKADRQNTETPIGGNAKKRDKTKPADPNNYVLKNL